MEIFKSIWDSGQVPQGWQSAQVLKVNVKNRLLLAELRKIKTGKWKKVYHIGVDGTEIHYFEHETGGVFNVKIKRIIR
jgi:hypothetical protein